jgi:hypothetical protein
MRLERHARLPSRLVLPSRTTCKRSASGQKARQSMKWWKAIILCYFLVHASVYAFLVPPCEAPDEPAHLAYINEVARYRKLPNARDQPDCYTWEAHQPPLYYMIGAILPALFKPDRIVVVNPIENQGHAVKGGKTTSVPRYSHVLHNPFASPRDQQLFYALRLLSVGMSALTLLFLMRLGEMLIEPKPWALLPAWLVASLPQFAFVSGVINNDNVANLLGAASLYRALLLLRQPRRLSNYLWLGACLGLGLLAKKTLLFLLPGVGFILVFSLWRQRSNWLRIIAGSCLAAMLMLAISAPWFVRNHWMYGDWSGTVIEKELFPQLVWTKSPTSEYFWGSAAGHWLLHRPDFEPSRVYIGLSVVAVIAIALAATRLGRLIGRALALIGILSASLLVLNFETISRGGYVGPFVVELYTTFIGRMGLMVVPLPWYLYQGYALIILVGLAGLVLQPAAQRRPPFALTVFTIFAGCSFAGVAYYNLTFTQPQGRLLFPALGALTVPIAWGLSFLFSGQRRAALRIIVIAALVGWGIIIDLIGIDSLLLFYWKAHQYAN